MAYKTVFCFGHSGIGLRLESPQPLLRLERPYESEDHAGTFAGGAGNRV